jgi:hypothetical protein
MTHFKSAGNLHDFLRMTKLIFLWLLIVLTENADCQGRRVNGRAVHKTKKKKTKTLSQPPDLGSAAEDVLRSTDSSIDTDRLPELKRDEAEPLKIVTFHSDNLFLEVQRSKLPGETGEGVFAKTSIPPGEILCEMRGAVMSVNDPVKILTDKNVRINGTDFYIIGDGVCSVINDCVAILGKSFGPGDIERIMIAGSDEVMPLHEDCQYNAKLYTTALGKIFALSTKPIAPGEEIYVAYGRYEFKLAQALEL